MKRKKVLPEERTYMRDYYEMNRDKFAKYRETFRAKHPGYYREYKQKRLNKKAPPMKRAPQELNSP